MAVSIQKNLFIASEVRSGSTYIAESISYAFNQFFGFEFWDLAQEKFSHIDDNSKPEDITQRCKSLFLDKSGFSSAKIMCKSLSVIHRNSDTSNDLRDCFFGPDTYWIVVRRRDRIAQAVSLAMARKSGLYHFYGDPSEAPNDETAVDFEDITSALQAISLSDIYLSTFSQQLRPKNLIEIYYEDFLKDEAKYLNKASKLCGLAKIDKYTYKNASKLKQTSKSEKDNLNNAYSNWFLKNYI